MIADDEAEQIAYDKTFTLEGGYSVVDDASIQLQQQCWDYATAYTTFLLKQKDSIEKAVEKENRRLDEGRMEIEKLKKVTPENVIEYVKNGMGSAGYMSYCVNDREVNYPFR